MVSAERNKQSPRPRPVNDSWAENKLFLKINEFRKLNIPSYTHVAVHTDVSVTIRHVGRD